MPVTWARQRVGARSEHAQLCGTAQGGVIASRHTIGELSTGDRLAQQGEGAADGAAQSRQYVMSQSLIFGVGFGR
jgi:hypothetical protein